jgi:tetratricopeptide (TPR) repeat protein
MYFNHWYFKYMKTVTLLLSLIFIVKCAAQQSQIDSVQLALQKNGLTDTTRWQLLNKAAEYYNKNVDNQGAFFAEEALAIARRLKDSRRMAESFKLLANNHSAIGNDSLANENYQLALKHYRAVGDSLNSGKTIHLIALQHFNNGEYYKAIERNLQSLDIFEYLGDTERVATATNSMGVNYLYIGDYPKALDCYFKSFRLCESIGDSLGMANAFTNMGLVYNRIGQYDKALQNHKKALSIFRYINHKNGIANSLANLGNVYDNKGEVNNALEYYEEALVEYRSGGNKRGVARTLTNMGIAHINLKNYEAALDSLQKSVRIYIETGDKSSLAIAYSYISETYFKLPSLLLQRMNIKQSEAYLKAEGYAMQSLRLGQQLGSIATQSESWGSLSNIYEAQKDYPAALEAYKQYKILGDSLLNDDKKEAITRSEMQFEQDKKDALLKASHAVELQEQKIKKYTAVGSVCVLLLASATSFIFYKRKRDAAQTVKEADFLAKVADTEMKALRAQMNPHFIFNSLNSIADYIDRRDGATASIFTVKFAKLMRMILENSEQKEVPLVDDLKALTLYMQLEMLRLNNKFSYQIKLDEEIDAGNVLIPPLLLQPFVENSIWHGFAKMEAGGQITISITKEDDWVICSVEDNGSGRREILSDNLREPKRKSMGIKITKARIEIANEKNLSDSTVQTYDLAQGTKVVIAIPFSPAF